MPRKASQPIRFGEQGAIVEEAQELQLLGPEALALLCPAAPYAMPQTGVLIGKAVLRTSLRGFLVFGFLFFRRPETFLGRFLRLGPSTILPLYVAMRLSRSSKITRCMP